MGLFGKKREFARSAPAGWVTETAMVGEVTVLTDGGSGSEVRGGDAPTSYTPVDEYSYSYIFPDASGKMVEVRMEDRVKRLERPKAGMRVTIAFNPDDPRDLVLLEDEMERLGKTLGKIKRLYENGERAPVTVTSVKPTGRVAPPAYESEQSAVEKMIGISVSQDTGDAFERKMAFWDMGEDVEVGASGVYLFDPADPENGVPRFPDADERAAGGDPIENHLNAMGAALRRAKIPRKYR